MSRFRLVRGSTDCRVAMLVLRPRALHAQFDARSTVLSRGAAKYSRATAHITHGKFRSSATCIRRRARRRRHGGHLRHHQAGPPGPATSTARGTRSRRRASPTVTAATAAISSPSGFRQVGPAGRRWSAGVRLGAGAGGRRDLPRPLLVHEHGGGGLLHLQDPAPRRKRGRGADSELHPATKSFRSTAHSRSPPLSVTTNDSEIAAPKSSSHIPDWK